MCCYSQFGVGQLPEDVISGVNFQFGVFVFKRCSRPCDVKRSVCFPVPEMERAGLGLRVGGCACSRSVAQLGLR